MAGTLVADTIRDITGTSQIGLSSAGATITQNGLTNPLGCLPWCSVLKNNGQQTLPGSVWSAITFNWIQQGGQGPAYTLNANGGIKVPVAGTYRISTICTVTPSPALHIMTALFINGVATWYLGAITTTAGWYSSIPGECVYALNAGDSIDLYVYTYGVTGYATTWGQAYGHSASQMKVQRIA